MPKLRKALGSASSPYIQSLMRLIESQSKETIARWCIGYAEAYVLPIYERACPGDLRPRSALLASRRWFRGEAKLPEVKNIILNECHQAARELQDNPAAQAAARACGQAASCCHAPGHALALAFYGTAAIAYDKAGLLEKPAVYDAIAAEECAKMEAALRDIAIPNEPNPAKINWRF